MRLWVRSVRLVHQPYSGDVNCIGHWTAGSTPTESQTVTPQQWPIIVALVVLVCHQLSYIISRGFIDNARGAIAFFVAVLIVAGTHELFGKRLLIWDLPYQRES